ncbi:MAG: hypothetical protein JWR19_2568 [Pedosphaera sp.]|nr:hypothetical protein [Pedosphaera sp.]
MNAWKVILTTLVIFGAGVFTGGFLVSNAIHVKAKANPSTKIQTSTPWYAHAKELLHRMEHDLNLSKEQHEHIEKIITDSQDRTRSLWKPIIPQMNQEIQKVNDDIRDQLTPEQRVKFDELLKARPAKKTEKSEKAEEGSASERRRHSDGTNALPPVAAPATSSVPAAP